ncbi:MAG: hypothetical protein AAFX65_07495 [Cyanobacteria bacterium J06638_7]
MGWSYTTRRKTKQQFAQDCLYGLSHEVLDHSIVGNHLWLVFRNSEGTPEIGLYLMAKEQGFWGCKGLTESCGPYHWDCPLRLLKLAPQPDSEYAQKWRDGVHRYHAAKRKQRASKPKIGDTIRLTAERFGAGWAGLYTVTRNLGRRGLTLTNQHGGNVRMPAYMVKHAERCQPDS